MATARFNQMDFSAQIPDKQPKTMKPKISSKQLDALNKIEAMAELGDREAAEARRQRMPRRLSAPASCITFGTLAAPNQGMPSGSPPLSTFVAEAQRPERYPVARRKDTAQLSRTVLPVCPPLCGAGKSTLKFYLGTSWLTSRPSMTTLAEPSGLRSKPHKSALRPMQIFNSIFITGD